MAYWYLIPTAMQMMGSIGAADAQKAQADAQAEQMMLEAEAQSLSIDRELNDALENQALVATAQGRTGGTTQVIREESQRRADVDKSLLRLGAESRAGATRLYGKEARNAGIMNAIGQATMTTGKVEGWWK